MKIETKEKESKLITRSNKTVPFPFLQHTHKSQQNKEIPSYKSYLFEFFFSKISKRDSE